jgi:hypothetical protein
MSRKPLVRPGTVPVNELPDAARAYGDLPYSIVTNQSRQYHLRFYERWCAEHNMPAWPATLERLLTFAASCAKTQAYYTIRGHLLVITMVERKRSGIDLFADSRMYHFLGGLKRVKPPQPVSPLRADRVDALLAYQPKFKSQRTTRTIILLSYTAGFTLNDHANFRCEMVTFDEDGAMIEGLDLDRHLFHIGLGSDPDRCPVRALRALIDGRTAGPVYWSSRAHTPDGALSYRGIACDIQHYGRAAAITPLSNERIRLAGMIEQARHVDFVRLAHFHGYRQAETLARLLGHHIPGGGAFGYPGHRRGP